MKKNFVKILIYFIITTLNVAFIGCENTSKSDNTSETKQTSTTEKKLYEFSRKLIFRQDIKTQVPRGKIWVAAGFPGTSISQAGLSDHAIFGCLRGGLRRLQSNSSSFKELSQYFPILDTSPNIYIYVADESDDFFCVILNRDDSIEVQEFTVLN